MRQNQRDWYYKQLDEYFPGIKQKYLKQYGNTYECKSPKANKLWQIFKKECETFGILYHMEDIITGYKQGYDYNQLSLF